MSALPESLSPTAVVVSSERRQRRWSQADLAERLAEQTGDDRWKRPRVARLEADRLTVDVEVLAALSKVLDLDYATLIDGYARRGQPGGGVTAGFHGDGSDLQFFDSSTEELPLLTPLAA